MRPESPTAVVLRRGGSKVFCSIAWDLASDAFSVGQWCKHKLYPHRCDISPSGRWMVYFALNGRWRSPTRGSWTALSRAPYLKAIKLWPSGDTWGGGGMFYRRSQLPEGCDFVWNDDRRVDDDSCLVLGALAGYWHRYGRNGWSVDPSQPRSYPTDFSRPVGLSWTLRKRVETEGIETHRLEHATGKEIERDAWQWADYDEPRSRVIWAEHGVIRAAAIGPDGLGPARDLFDANPMTFEPIKAPYDDDTEFIR